MKIRSFDNADSDDVIDMVEKGRPYVVPYNKYVYWIMQNYYGTTCKVIELEDRIIGYISAMPSIEKNTLFIWQICIANDFRGRGLGELLLNDLKEEAIKLGFYSFQFSIAEENLTSQKLFRKFADKNNLKIFEIERMKFQHVTEIVFQIDI